MFAIQSLSIAVLGFRSSSRACMLAAKMDSHASARCAKDGIVKCFAMIYARFPRVESKTTMWIVMHRYPNPFLLGSGLLIQRPGQHDGAQTSSQQLFDYHHATASAI